MRTYHILEDLEHSLALEVVIERSRRPDVKAALRKAQRLTRTVLPEVETTNLWVPLAAVLALGSSEYDNDSAIRILNVLSSEIESGVHFTLVEDIEQIVAALDEFIAKLMAVN